MPLVDVVSAPNEHGAPQLRVGQDLRDAALVLHAATVVLLVFLVFSPPRRARVVVVDVAVDVAAQGEATKRAGERCGGVTPPHIVVRPRFGASRQRELDVIVVRDARAVGLVLPAAARLGCGVGHGGWPALLFGLRLRSPSSVDACSVMASFLGPCRFPSFPDLLRRLFM